MCVCVHVCSALGLSTLPRQALGLPPPSPAVNPLVQRALLASAFGSWECAPRSGIAGSCGSSVPSGETARLLSVVSVRWRQSAQRSLPARGVLCRSVAAIPGVRGGPTAVLSCFPDGQWCWASFHLLFGPVCVFFGEISVQKLVVGCSVELQSSLFRGYMVCKCSLPFYRLSSSSSVFFFFDVQNTWIFMFFFLQKTFFFLLLLCLCCHIPDHCHIWGCEAFVLCFSLRVLLFGVLYLGPRPFF